ncbi:MAG TPA: penicillin-binding protein 1B, partial [Gammaproteobacteria bacterium]
FTFWDAQEPPRNLTIGFSRQRISEMLDNRSGRTLQLMRLEPALIASIYPSHKEDRDLIRLDETPELLLRALVAVEDRDFYSHHGVKPSAILRALVANVRAGAAVQGGSTLTQQLVKNFFLNNERTLRRKAVEAVMALLLELHYSKEEILEAYLNEVYLGQEGDRAIHGFALASRFYFDRPLSELKTEQLALLVGLVKGPSYYNPWRHPERARERRNLAIDVMLAEDLLKPEEARLARLTPLSIRPQEILRTSSYPAFVDLVKRQLHADYRDEDLRSEGLRIFTTFDPQIQAAAEEVLSLHLDAVERRRGFERDSLQGAMVVTSTDTAEVLAVVGDRNPRYPGYNRALDATRPIGSLVKPAVYLTALERLNSFNPVSVIEDAPIRLEYPDGRVWEPANYDGKVHGEVPLFHGLIYSYNLATARLGMLLGVENVVATLEKMGLDQAPPDYPSLLLGALELSPLQVAELYQTLATNGFRMPARAVRDVLTADGQKLTRYSLQVRQTLDPSVVYLINNLLQKVVETGTAKSAGARLPALKAAGKTGTSDELRDSWFAGFTGQHLAVVWVGRDDNQPMGLSGAAGALPAWINLFSRIDSRPLQMPLPGNVEHVWIDLASGKRSRHKCDTTLQLPFIIGTAPKATIDCRKSLLDWLFD